MKKFFIVLASAIAITGTLSLTACSKDSSNATNKFDDLNTAQSAYGFSAASAGMIISDMAETTPVETPEQGTVPEQGTGETTVNSELDGYMTLVDSLLSDGGFTTISQTSDRPEYSEKIVVTYRNMQNEQNSYIMYYNQVLTETEVDRDETEETFDITGIMLIGETEYPIRGEREVSTERGESEIETKFRVQISETSYMLVEQSQEDDGGETEQEFSYSLYENGKLKERSTFEYEEERGETELKMTSFKDGKSEIICFEKVQKKGREVIRLRTGSKEHNRGYLVEKKTDADGNTYYEYTPDTEIDED